jgi:hypothetical protein
MRGCSSEGQINLIEWLQADLYLISLNYLMLTTYLKRSVKGLE